MDIEKTFSTLTEKSDISLIRATDVELFVESQITFWCKIHASKEYKDPSSLYQQRLFDQGYKHQEKTIDESYEGAIEKKSQGENEGFRLTLELMFAGEKNIKNMPLICGSLGLQGRPDVLMRVDDVESALGSYSYSVVEIKSARNIQKYHILQGAVYNRLIGLVQDYEPPEFYIVNRDGVMQTIQMSDYNPELDRVLSEMRAVIEGRRVIEPWYDGGKWPWKNYVNTLAIEANDISLISGVGVTTREALIHGGYRNLEALMNAKIKELTKIRGIAEKKARKFITSARAIYESYPVRRDHNVQLEKSSIQVFLDLEGTDPRIGVDGLDVTNYLIGALVRRDSEPATFIPFFAKSLGEEKLILEEFLEWSASLGDATFYHWHHYERTHLTKMADHFNISPTKAAPVMEHLVDLHPITTKAFAFPTYREGLKEIAKSLGFNWRHTDVDALESVALYFQYLDSACTDEEARQKILDYNEDDCLATMYIFDWLLSQQNDV
jgi:predicted RecB family nuclease